ncbi:Kel2p NDAI_0D02600 [Naumovozyma dairenensis CBS 421]|uniref:Uncharacterized protein n=1 Tax=Naumovozyma dairenensis (strain ATCC 10597 / BCRC 20456 / CBS 421 / NBRC 0211 / NRRL Y-12639) TaxID=1071378 RepID=G0W9W3_NAUDC|nr:hypothetical protein NDAI_0D02600 [Naumovozyma dairenensis CBS 421]CCD24574.1 hypothetical protein NDAI_0D02600 [Naumovozyma dairenensis CBS 421]
MAPFKFGKKSNKDKNKREFSNESNGTLNHSPGSKQVSTPPKTRLPMASAFHPFQKQHPQQQQQQQQQQTQAPVSPPRDQLPSEHNTQQQPFISHNIHPQQQEQQPQQHSRIFMTPTPAGQRNVSAASSTMPMAYSQTLGNNLPSYNEPTDYHKLHPTTIWNRIKLQNSPFPRYRHVASSYVSDDGKIYVIGGLHDQSVYGDTWILSYENNGLSTTITSKTVDISENTPPPRVGHAATLCGNAFVIFGGDTHKVNKDGSMDDDIYLFNINSYKWTIPKPVGQRPLGRYGHKISIIATSQMKTKLYLFGGQFDDTYFNDLVVFDLSSFRRPDSHWEFIRPKSFIPPPLTNHTMCSYDHKLWVFGGDTLQGLTNQVFMYDPVDNDWCVVETFANNNDVSNIPPPIQEHAAVLYKDLMCVIGGKDESDNYLNDVYFLNLKTLKWFKLPFYKEGVPQGRSGHSVTLLKNDKILIMGGDKFDYANIDSFDFHTSDTNMGKGTILYVLDLSNLEKLCPGIFNNNFENSSPIKFNPTTPPINSYSRNIESTNNNNSTPMNNNGTLPTSIAQNILTPYAQPQREEEEEETVTKTAIPKSETEAAVAKLSPYAGQNELANMSPEEKVVSSLNHNATLSPTYPNEKPRISHSSSSDLNATIGERHPLDSPDVERTKEFDTVQEDINVANLPKSASPVPPPRLPSPSPSDSNAASTLSSPEMSKHSSRSPVKLDDPILVTKGPMNSLAMKGTEGNGNGGSETQFESAIDSDVEIDHPHSETDVSAPGDSYHADDDDQHTDVIPSLDAAHDETKHIHDDNDDGDEKGEITIDRVVLEKMRNELYELKTSSKENAKIASDHIKELEKELEEVKQNHSFEHDSLEKSLLEDKLHEFENLLSSKFLDVEHLNEIIKQQNKTIETYELEPIYKKKYEELQRDYEFVTEENDTLKKEATRYELDLRNNIISYSSSLDELLSHWKQMTIMKNQKLDDGMKSEVAIEDDNGHHKSVVDKLSNRLDDLIAKSQEMSESKDKLSKEYQSLELKHSTLSQELLSKENELEKTEKNYKDSLDAVATASKALKISQQEVEKYKLLNKKLQLELEREQIMSSSSPDDSVTGMSGTTNVSEQPSHSTARETHLNMKISNLEAELFIIKQERDSMKDEMLELKKKLLTMDSTEVA